MCRHKRHLCDGSLVDPPAYLHLDLSPGFVIASCHVTHADVLLQVRAEASARHLTNDLPVAAKQFTVVPGGRSGGEEPDTPPGGPVLDLLQDGLLHEKTCIRSPSNAGDCL